MPSTHPRAGLRVIALIVAMAQNGVIGYNGSIPWRIPGEQKYFKRLTWGHIVVMGRKTFDSIGHPLPQRKNYVMTHDSSLRLPGCEVIGDPAPVFALDSREEIYIIGGTSIFAMFLGRADRFYQTLIEQEIEGDTWFPAWDPAEWQLESSLPGPSTSIPHRFNVYVRKQPSQTVKSE